MKPASYNTWVASISMESYSAEAGQVVLSLDSDFKRNYVRQHYRPLLQQALHTLTGRAIEVDLCVCRTTGAAASAEAACVAPPEASPLPVAQQAAPSPPSPEAWQPPTSALAGLPKQHPPDHDTLPLNLRYTFDAYVVGPYNRLAHAAAQAIAQRPGQHYNPLLLYGPSGTGKTHLMQAIGHYCNTYHPSLRVGYITAEQFTNQLVYAIQTKRMDKFRDKYRRIDVLLLDDIAFLAKKERTQEEVFHTFNALHQAGKQIVLTSDRSPREIAGLDERLCSRFEGGLPVDVQPPDTETREAILHVKLERDGFSQLCHLGEGVLRTLAEIIPNNVRELEGALNRVMVVAMLEQRTIHANELPDLLGLAPSLTLQQQTALSPQRILQVVARYFRLAPCDLTGASRQKQHVQARQWACYLLRQQLQASYPQVGAWMGHRSHSSVMHACQQVSKTLASTPKAQQCLAELTALLAHSH
jgi:chromosomal replication initiator protein